MTTSLPAKATELLDANVLVVLSTLNPDGSVQSTPVWAMLDGDDVLISTTQDRKKARNLEADPRVSVLVLDPADAFSYFSINGTATVTLDEHGLIDTLAHRYTGGPYTFDGPDAVRVVVRVTPEHVVGQ
jgi:PPOX class probable F420-dependent enzyme